GTAVGTRIDAELHRRPLNGSRGHLERVCELLKAARPGAVTGLETDGAETRSVLGNPHAAAVEAEDAQVGVGKHLVPIPVPGYVKGGRTECRTATRRAAPRSRAPPRSASRASPP